MPSPPVGRNFGGTHSAWSERYSRRQTTKIHRIELNGAHIKELHLAISRDLVDDLGFADTAGAPNMQWHTLADQRMQRFQEC